MSSIIRGSSQSFQGKKILGDLCHRNKCVDLRAMSLGKIKEIFHPETPKKCVSGPSLMECKDISMISTMSGQMA